MKKSILILILSVLWISPHSLFGQVSSQDSTKNDDWIDISTSDTSLESLDKIVFKEEFKILKPILLGMMKDKVFKWWEVVTLADTNIYNIHNGELLNKLLWLGNYNGLNDFRRKIIEYKDVSDYPESLTVNLPKLQFDFLHDNLFRVSIADQPEGLYYYNILNWDIRTMYVDSVTKYLGVKSFWNKDKVLEWKSKNIGVTLDYGMLTIYNSKLLLDGTKRYSVAYNLKDLEKWMLDGQYDYQTLKNTYFSNYGKIRGAQGFNWGVNFQTVKTKLKTKANVDSINSMVNLIGKVAGKDANIKYSFVANKLKFVDVHFGELLDLDSLGKFITAYDSVTAFTKYEEIKSLLFEKYGICTNAFDGEMGTQLYTWGDTPRLKEIDWDLGTTIVSLSINLLVDKGSNVRNFYLRCSYFDPNFFEERKGKWKDDL